jgi:hypothetical protein
MARAAVNSSRRGMRVAALCATGLSLTVLVAGCASSTAKQAGGQPSNGPSTSPSGGPGTPSHTPSSTPTKAAKPTPSSPTSAGGNSGGTSGSGGSGGSVGTPRCHTSGLSGSFTLVPNSQGAGNEVAKVTLTNTSGTVCHVYGFVGMQLLNAQHQPLPTNVVRDHSLAELIVTLIPNGSASAAARFSPDVPGPGDAQNGQCQPTAAFVEITPPDETTHLVVPVQPATSVCSSGQLRTTSLIPGGDAPANG